MIEFDGLHEDREPVTIALWVEEDAPALEGELVEAGFRLARGAEHFDVAVLVGEPRLLLVQAAQLRNGGFRGVIVAGCVELARSEGLALRTAGMNEVVEWTGEGALVDAVLSAWSRVRGRSVSAVGLDYSVEENSRRVRIGSLQLVLSAARFRLLECLMARPGSWWRAPELVAAVQRTHHRLDSPLVRVHMNAIRNALGTARWCVQSERTFGYQFVTNPDVLPLLGSRRPWSNGRGTSVFPAGPRSGAFLKAEPWDPEESEAPVRRTASQRRGGRGEGSGGGD